MADTPVRDAKLADLLNEAYAKEKELEMALEAHLEATTREDYERRLKEHLKETRSHATAVSRRIKQLGGEATTVSVPGPEGLTKAAKGVQDVVGKAKAAAQTPLDAVRGSGEQEKMLRNARQEFQEEAHEIATYTVIDSVATAVGDRTTAELARSIRRDEERMQKFLGDLLPSLSTDMVHDEVPISEISGGGTPRGTSSRTRAKAGRS